MATISWTNFGSGNWSDGSNWDTGTPPGPGDDAFINVFSFYTVAATGSITVNSVTFDNADGAIEFANTGGTDTVTSFFDNIAGVLGLDTADTGGTTFKVGTLTNTGTIAIGNAAMTEASTLLVTGTLDDTGSLSLTGGTSVAATAFLLVNGAAPGTLTGSNTFTGNTGGAVLSWASGSVTQIGDNDLDFGVVALVGGNAITEIGTTGATNALAGLATIADNGELSLSDGAALTITNGLTVLGGGFGGTLLVDGTGAGGSRLTVGGNLINSSTAATFNFGAATVNVGNATMTSAGTLTVDGTFDDANSNLVLDGGAVTGATAVMDISGAAPGTLTGSIHIVGNVGGAVLRWGSGGITEIGDGASISAEVTIDGANAFMAIGAVSNNSALASLATIASNGMLELDDGVVLNAASSLSVTGTLMIDGAGETGAGGSDITFGDLGLTGAASMVQLGDASMTAADTLTITGTVANDGIVELHGGGASGAVARMTISGATPATLTGLWLLTADTGGASVSWGSGGITQIGDGTIDSALNLTGANAYAEIGASNSDSALTNLATVAVNASFELNDGATLTTANGLTIDPTGAVLIDASGTGGSDVTIGGNVIDQAPFAFDQGFEIGNNAMTSADTVTVEGTVNVAGGFLDLNGGAVAGATANLVETGAAPGTLLGYYALGQIGTIVNSTIGVNLEWASGGIVQIGDGVSDDGFFSLAGANTHAEIGPTGNNSALDTLRTIAADSGLVISFGASVVTTGALTVQTGAVLYVDGGDHGGGGGSSLTIGGDLVNQSGAANRGVQIGNTSVTIASTVAVQGNFVNTGGILYLTGGTIAGAAADMLISGAAPGTLTGDYDIGPTTTVTSGYIIYNPNAGGAALDWGSGAITQIGGSSGYGGMLITGANDFAEVGATNSNSALDDLATIAGNGFLSIAFGVTVATSATLTVQNGGVLEMDSGALGGGDRITISGDLINQSGADGLSNGVLEGNTSITANDTLTIDGALVNQATGALTITGGTGTDTSTSSVDIGTGASNAGLVTVNHDGLLFVASGTYTQTGGTTTLSGELEAGTASIAAGTLALNGGVAAASTIGISAGAHALGFGSLTGALANAGSVEASGGTLTIGGTVSGAGAFSVDAGAVINFGSSVASGQIVTFNGTAATVELGAAANFAGTIAAFAAGDIIDLASLTFVAGATATISGGILSVISNGITDTLSVSGLANGTQFATSQETGGTRTDVQISCFAAGTLIRTSRGDIPVEALTEGDCVTTASGDEQRIAWIGHRHIVCGRQLEPQKLWPVQIRAGAFGPALPRRDLWLSPDHAVFVDDVLIPIRHLINGDSIKAVACDEITYYHVELGYHDVLLAEGLPVESYLDTGDRANFANSGAVTRLFPDFSPPRRGPLTRWEAMGCAPLIVTGPRLAAVRQRVNALLRASDSSLRRIA